MPSSYADYHSYKIKDIIKLPEAQFNFLVENVEDYMRHRDLAKYLYRSEINKMVFSELDPEDEDTFKQFLRSHIELRSTKRRRCETLPPTIQIQQDDEEQIVTEISRLQGESEICSSVPPFKENREMKHMYTNGPASAIMKFPEPFRRAIQNCRQWKWERSQGLETTECWGTLFPKGDTQDVSYTLWCSNEDGYYLNDIFKLQHTISASLQITR